MKMHPTVLRRHFKLFALVIVIGSLLPRTARAGAVFGFFVPAQSIILSGSDGAEYTTLTSALLGAGVDTSIQVGRKLFVTAQGEVNLNQTTQKVMTVGGTLGLMHYIAGGMPSSMQSPLGHMAIRPRYSVTVVAGVAHRKYDFSSVMLENIPADVLDDEEAPPAELTADAPEQVIEGDSIITYGTKGTMFGALVGVGIEKEVLENFNVGARLQLIRSLSGMTGYTATMFSTQLRFDYTL